MAKRKPSEKAIPDEVSTDATDADTSDSTQPDTGSDDTLLDANVSSTEVIEIPDHTTESDDSAETRDDGPVEDHLIEAEAVDITADEVDPGPEPQAEREPQPETQTAGTAASIHTEPARTSAFPLFLGGVVAALLGFIAARAEILDPILPPGLRAKSVDAAILDQLDATTQRLAELEATVAALPEPQVIEPAPAPEPVDLSAIDDQLLALTARLDALVARPPVEAEIPTDALDAALADLRRTAEAQQAEIDKLLADARLVREDAEASANATLARAAMTRILSAIDSGAPFAAALSDLQQAGNADVPDALSSVADDGVTPLAELQADIPDAARIALAEARTQDNDNGFGSFFQRQLGARSIEPREGSDPDAVLSRIEAAVRAGRLGDALAEAETLPDPARAALGPWIEQARTRHDAVTAANALAERLSAL